MTYPTKKLLHPVKYLQSKLGKAYFIGLILLFLSFLLLGVKHSVFDTLSITPSSAHAATQKTIFITSGTTFSAPADWPGKADSVEVIGGGGGADAGNGSLVHTGGAGGGYSKTTNLTVANGASLQVGTGGAGGTSGVTYNLGTSGGNTWFKSTGDVFAQGGEGANYGNSHGGAAASGVGSTKYTGGSGVTSASTAAGSGGGGAAGPNGNGANGGVGQPSRGVGGGGGGGNGGGSAGNENVAGGLGGNGGNNSGGTGHGVGSTASGVDGGAGTVGGGGGGGAGSTLGTQTVGGAGGPGNEWDSTHGSGGGGGGAGGGTTAHIGGAGGLYGGGGGTGSNDGTTNGGGGAGASGLIVIKYTPNSKKTYINTSFSGITSGLVGYWTFDGATTTWSSATAGKTGDSSGNFNTGTMTNMSQSLSPVPGISGQALKFDGVNDYVNLGSASSLTSVTFPYTVSFWMNPAVIKDERILNLNLTDTNAYVSIGLYLTSDMIFIGRNADRLGLLGISTYVTINKWQHWTIVYTDSSHTSLYINGVSKTLSSTGDFYLVGAGNYIGTKDGTAGYFNGSIDDVRIYNRALSANEVTSLYNAGKAKLNINKPVGSGATGLASGLVGYWSFDGKDTNWGTNKTNDLSGQGNTGTMVSMSTTTSPVAGVIGQGLKFDGVDDKVDTGSDSIGTGADSVCAWVYAKGWGANDLGRIIDNTKFILYINGSPQWIYFTSDGGVTATNPVGFTLNRWHFICATRDASGANSFIYDNGAVLTSGSSGTPATGTNVIIGSRTADTARTWNGYIDDVRLYSRQLSATEITSLYNAGKAKLNISN